MTTRAGPQAVYRKLEGPACLGLVLTERDAQVAMCGSHPERRGSP